MAQFEELKLFKTLQMSQGWELNLPWLYLNLDFSIWILASDGKVNPPTLQQLLFITSDLRQLEFSNHFLNQY